MGFTWWEAWGREYDGKAQSRKVFGKFKKLKGQSGWNKVGKGVTMGNKAKETCRGQVMQQFGGHVRNWGLNLKTDRKILKAVLAWVPLKAEPEGLGCT